MSHTLSPGRFAPFTTTLLCLGLLATAQAGEPNATQHAYLSDSRNVIVRSGFNLCWHSGTGPAPTRDCDPQARAPIVLSQAKPAEAIAPLSMLSTPPLQRERITLDADTLFDFDQAVLRPAGRQALDDFMASMRARQTETIMAVGHADRIGSRVYNQDLSEQRVAAVKAYLVEHGIAARRIHTEGRGETEPSTELGDCNTVQGADLIRCLQADRRVDIEVILTGAPE